MNTFCDNDCPMAEKEDPTFELLKLDQGNVIKEISAEDIMAFVIKGKIDLSIDVSINSEIKVDDIIYLPIDCHYLARILEDSTLLIVRIHDPILFCNCLRIMDLIKSNLDECCKSKHYVYLLETNPEIKQFISFIQTCIDKGICCREFFQHKIAELFFLMRAFYPQDNLAQFFSRALHSDSGFSSYITHYGHNYKSVSELAEALHYSVSGFEKHFKRVFGVSPYKWMLRNKAEKIYYEIRLEKQSFKEICDEFGFSSISHFTNFCKSYLGTTPSNIRKSGKSIAY
ncbi:helix-turn-helix domain-containing protein [Dysgonomonas termitidis]|uniref:Helix-turn-helix domain-containing protein n=1 Tax=Dysgonomonas termitidis TaxID=1516126 RepID=A0ABV9KUF4_9BACT